MEQVQEEFIGKMEQLYADFRQNLLQQDKEYIFEQGYKISKMQDILSILQEEELSEEKIALLHQEENPLEIIYQQWLTNSYTEDNDALRLTVSEYFQELEEQEMSAKSKGQIEILVVPPLQRPYTTKIAPELSAMQTVVGGLIEPIYLDDVAIVVNEEGKVNNFELNRSLYDENGERMDIIAGTFFVCGLGEENFTSLTAEQKEKYAQEFAKAELFYYNEQGAIASLKVEVVEDKPKSQRTFHEQEQAPR